MDVEAIDNKLYKAIYINENKKEGLKIWNRIKTDDELLKEAIKIVKTKFKDKDTLKGCTIANNILSDYENVDSSIYNELVYKIYKSTDIARIVMNGYSNGGYSFLLLTLSNDKLKLTDEQKSFAISEAMNKIGTIKYEQEHNNYLNILDQNGITDSITTYIDIGGVNPIGAKTKNVYLKNTFDMLSDKQCHGLGEFDIRYYILRNSNWSLEEKKKLIMDFYACDEYYDNVIDAWEWDIVNDSPSKSDLGFYLKENMYILSYDELLKVYKEKNIVDNIYDEIKFLKLMHELRPTSYEKDYKVKIKK